MTCACHEPRVFGHRTDCPHGPTLQPGPIDRTLWTAEQRAWDRPLRPEPATGSPEATP